MSFLNLPATDLPQKYYHDGTQLTRQAIAMDKSGNYEMAKTFYLQAVQKFKLALQQKDCSESIKPKIDGSIKKCTQRASELDNLIQTPEVIPSRGGAAQRARKKGDKSSKQEDQDEKNEFNKRMEDSIVIEKPDISWADVAGLEGAKRALTEAVILPLKFKQFFVGERAPWRGILLYGPPGTGKSYLAKATASEANSSTFITVSTSDLVSKWLGESEKLIRALFETARKHTPAIVFIDEIDSLLSSRSENDSEASRRIKTEFLVQLDGVGKSMEGILFLAATNIPWILDPAVRRRFEKKIYIPLPDVPAREAMIQIRLKKTPNNITKKQANQIAMMTDGYSAADIKILTREAAFITFRKFEAAEYFVEINGKLSPCDAKTKGAIKIKLMDPNFPADKLDCPPVTFEDFKVAIKNVRPSVSPKELTKFDEWTAQYGMEGN